LEKRLDKAAKKDIHLIALNGADLDPLWKDISRFSALEIKGIE